MHEELIMTIDWIRGELEHAFRELDGYCTIDIEEYPVIWDDNPEITLVFNGCINGVFACGCTLDYYGESVEEYVDVFVKRIRERISECGHVLSGDHIDGFKIRRATP